MEDSGKEVRGNIAWCATEVVKYGDNVCPALVSG